MTEKNKNLWDRAVSGINEEYTDEAADKVEDMISDDVNDSELIVYERSDKNKTPVFAIAAAVAAVIGVAVLTTLVITNSIFFNPYSSSESSSFEESSDKDDNSSDVINDVNSSESTDSNYSSESTDSSNSSQVVIGDFSCSYLDDGTVTITGYNGKEKNVVIPGSLGGREVTKIEDYAFYESMIEEVTISEGVQVIGENAFFRCKELRKVDFPDTLREIGADAFHSCVMLESITFPEELTKLGSSAFSWCKLITEVKIPKNIKNINEGVFCSCTSLTSVELPDGIQEIQAKAFYGCNFAEIKIPESVTKIGAWAFAYNETLEKIYLPKNVRAEKFGEYDYYGQTFYNPFIGCLGLMGIEVDPKNRDLYTRDGVLYAIKDNRLLAYPEGKPDTEYRLPEGVEIIGTLDDVGYIVSECNGNLQKLILPESLKHIGTRVFENMEWDFYIEFPAGLTDINIKEDAFIYAYRVIFLCRENSVAHQYAIEHNMRFELIE